MKLVLLSILSLTLLLSASAQINREWTRDWQNYFDSADLCTPRNFTIAADSSNTPVNITYFYEDYAAIYCTNMYYNQTFSNLTAVATNVIYNDSFGQQILYNPNQNIIQFTKPNSSQPFLYSVNGSYVPVQDVYYPLFGSWNSPQKTNASDQTVCCVPGGVYVTQLIDETNPKEGRIQLTMNYTSTNCSNTTTQVLEVWYSNISSVNFGDNRENSTIDLTFVPIGVNSQMSIMFNYTNKTCGYTYQKINTTPLIQGAWLLDWQSKDLSSPSPYQIQQYNNTYMYSNYTNRIKETVKSYVSIDLQGEYYDSGIEEGFIYNSTVNALINTADKLLYSQNGSLFSSANFPNNWANPVSSADSSSCCIPSYVEITANPDLPNQLNAIYFYPDKYDQTEGCQDYITAIYGGELVTTLSIKTPSLTELIWEDIIGNKVYWANPSDQSQLGMTVFGQCNLTLTVTTTPPPNPLSASWISSRVVGFIMGLFVIVNYI